MDKNEEQNIRNLYASGNTPFGDVLGEVNAKQTYALLYLLANLIDTSPAGLDDAVFQRQLLQAKKRLSSQDLMEARRLATKVFNFMDRQSFGEDV